MFHPAVFTANLRIAVLLILVKLRAIEGKLLALAELCVVISVGAVICIQLINAMDTLPAELTMTQLLAWGRFSHRHHSLLSAALPEFLLNIQSITPVFLLAALIQS